MIYRARQSQALLDAPRKRSAAPVRRFGVCVAVGIWLALTAPAADATFPGANGQIVFAKGSPTAYSGSPSTLWTVDPGTGRTRQVTRVPSSCDATEAWDDLAPAYSPSGRWIAFAHRDTCGNGERRGIYLMRADGTQKQLLVGGRELPAPYPGGTASLGLPVNAFGYPAWSRDGRRLAFLSGVMRAPIWVVEARPDGRVTKLPLTGGAEGRISWGPAQAIAFTRLELGAGGLPRGGAMIVTRPDGRGRRRLPAGLAPDWSPDGTRLAFNSSLLPDRGCGAEKYIGPRAAFRRSVQAGVREVAQMVPVDEGCISEAWAGSIYVMRGDGRDLHRVTTGGARRSHDLRQQATWSPDGKLIAFIRIHGPYKFGYVDDPVSTDIYVMTAGGGPIRRVTRGIRTETRILSLSWQALPRSAGSPAATKGSTGKAAKAAARRQRKHRLGATTARSDTDGTPTALLVGLIATALLTLATVALILRRRHNG